MNELAESHNRKGKNKRKNKSHVNSSDTTVNDNFKEIRNVDKHESTNDSGNGHQMHESTNDNGNGHQMTKLPVRLDSQEDSFSVPNVASEVLKQCPENNNICPISSELKAQRINTIRDPNLFDKSHSKGKHGVCPKQSRSVYDWIYLVFNLGLFVPKVLFALVALYTAIILDRIRTMSSNFAILLLEIGFWIPLNILHNGLNKFSVFFKFMVHQKRAG